MLLWVDGNVGRWECGNLSGGSVHILMDLLPHLGSLSYTKLLLAVLCAVFTFELTKCLAIHGIHFVKSFTSFYAVIQRREETFFIILILKVHNFVTYMVIRLLYSYKLFPP